jgi:hypothetical protein
MRWQQQQQQQQSEQLLFLRSHGFSTFSSLFSTFLF